MIFNYIKIALRVLLKFKVYSLINITGLAVGMTCSLLIVLYVMDELSYDQYHEHASVAYRVAQDITAETRNGAGSVRQLATTPSPVGPLLRQDFGTEFEAVSRLYQQPALVSQGEVKYQEEHFAFADPEFLDILSFNQVEGDIYSALTTISGLIITESMAAKYFGDSSPIGETLTFEGNTDFRVSAVIEDLPTNTHLHFDFLATFSAAESIHPWMFSGESAWHYPPMYTYVKLGSEVNPEFVDSKFPAFIQQHRGNEGEQTRSLHLQSVPDIHLRSQRLEELEPNGNIRYLYVLTAIAVFTLIVACINFMNLATARSASRAREIGVRKVVGARTEQLTRQFLSESVIQTFLAFAVALLLTSGLIPFFNQLSGKSLDLGHLSTGLPLAFTLGCVFLIGVFGGGYPAFYLSSLRPIQAMKNSLRAKSRVSLSVRRGLVIFQFGISFFMIVGTLIVFGQLDYMQNDNLGFDKEHIIVVPLRDEQDQVSYESFKNQLLQNPGIVAAAASAGVPGRGELSNFPTVPEGVPDSERMRMLTLGVDHEFVDTLGLEIVQGRDFGREYPSDANEGFILNQSALELLGWNEPIGNDFTLYYDHPDDGFIPKSGRVIGVIKDFHFSSFHQNVEPMLLHVVPPSYWTEYLTIRLAPENIEETISDIEQNWNEFNSASRPFEFSFLDEEYNSQYREEGRFGSLFLVFSALTIFIACLGLFGLVSYTAEQRTKEVGVRKVLGATVRSLMLLLAKDYVLLILIGIAVTTPITILSMNYWLGNFAYQMSFGFFEFAAAGAMLVLLALITASLIGFKSARANPVEALRYE